MLGYSDDNQDNDALQKRVKDLISQIESQRDQMNSLLRANQNYKDDYRNKVRSMNKSMAMKMAAMNRSMMEVVAEESCCKLYYFVFIKRQAVNNAEDLQKLRMKLL